MKPTSIDALARQDRTRREILSRSELIPALPDLVLRVVNLLNRPETEPEELERHIRYDQALVAKLLSMVNSPFYGVMRKITTVSDAIMVLGFRGVRSLVLASSAAKHMSREFPAYGFLPRGLWFHALTTATAARTIAKEIRLGMGPAEELFVAGLLHDVGKMLVQPYLTEAGVEKFNPNENMIDREREITGIDHTEAGALVCAKWNLSKELQTLVKDHHGADPSTEPSRDAAVIRIANQFARELGHGYCAEFHVARYDDADFRTAGISQDQWTEMRPRIEYEVDAALASLQDICS